MPSFVNEPNAISATNGTLSSFNHIPNNTNTSHLDWYDPATDLGYGVGRLLRGAFDQAWRTWQSFWQGSISQEEIVHQRQVMIYKKGLKECIIHLERAIDNLRKNPRDPQSMEKIKKVVAHYVQYVNPAPTEELSSYQQNVFQRLGEKVETLANSDLKETLMKFLPFLSLKHIRTLKAQELVDKLSVVSVASKSKRAVLATFPASFDLNSLDGSNGFTVAGIAASGLLGYSVSTAGDMNGDGMGDLVLGAFEANSGLGASYIIFGNSSGFPASFDLTTLNGINGFAILGVATEGYLGVSGSTAGDINGDGIDDLVLGADGVSSGLGASYVIFGSRSVFRTSFDLTMLNGTNGFAIPGLTVDGKLGSSISTAGDLNGDGIADLVLGAYSANSGLGASYIIFGSSSGFPASFNLTALNGTNGFAIPGVAVKGYLGVSVSNAGDINGDTLSDLILGAYTANSNWGVSYVIFGSRSVFPASFDLTTLNGINGFVIPGITAEGYLGVSVDTAGDINGDNLSDLILGAYGANSGLGASYVIFGSSVFPTSFDLTTLNGTNGFAIHGVAALGDFGVSVSTAGDINGDTLSDLVLGAYFVNSGLGASYVIFGSRSGFLASFNLSDLNGTNGFAIAGVIAGGYFGVSVSTCGDINGDNLNDLVVGADEINLRSGASYVIFGQNVSVVSSTPMHTPTPFSRLTPCPSGQPLMLGNNNIQINKGQNLRLTPNDLSAICRNNTTPNLGTNFTITGITHAQFKTRNSSGFWNNALSFFGNDLSYGNVELIQDNSTSAPQINFTVRDGQTTLLAVADVQFSMNESSVQVRNIAFDIPSNGTTILSPQQFQINVTGTQLDNVVISVVSTQDGYFTTVDNPITPILDFTYYQLQNGQIQFIHNGTVLSNITLSVSDGSGLPVLVSPIVTLLDTQTQNTGKVSKDAIIGSVVGAFALIAAGGLAAFGVFKYKEKRDHMVQQFGKAQAQDYRTHPPKTTNS